jgi:segregation and condensation protein A
LAPDLLARVSPERFAEIAFVALSPKQVPHVDVSHITPIRISVADAIDALRAELKRRKRATFRQLTHDVRHRLNLIVRFLAVLELVKRGEADVVQSGAFGQIDVEWLGEKAGVAVTDEYEGTSIEDEITLDEDTSERKEHP